ncbi:PREDICTED: nuclear GTPase SLIP-GC-like isoform X2 [Poecilia mexicana]|uniref:nuclear GTPase SLIP-GC-like isoform X2 n=1 Tax=Poecilia mexicana TaxID=48701 RepID=UPI00072DFD62|nr:PREDICTED: nuclear GTPase SLIP-GC-like isoform X2 [Poecilia mexicana]
MDDFVRDTLAQAGLNDLIKVFKDEGIDTETFYMLQDADIEKLIPKMGSRLKFKKLIRRLKAEQTPNESPNHFPTHGHQKGEEETGMTEVLPSTSDTGKRKSGQQLGSKGQPAAKRKCETNSSTETEAKMLNTVRNTMGDIYAMLQDDSDLNKILKTKIKNLETEKKELVGVFGKTGAGKTSLINAVLKEKNLLPSGSVSACTSVMIKVEGNRQNEKYEAEIEFISPEDWEDELGSLLSIIKKGNQETEDNVDDSDEEHHDAADKLSALYEDEWKEKSCEQLMETKYFKEIPEFLCSTSKTLVFESAKDLSTDIVKYTRDAAKNEDYDKIKKWYWPLVKCVTVRVPDNPFLQHVTLVDLPGNGDRNKSRDTMWKGVVGNCSTVWIVSEINRAASDRESWEILKSASNFLGNGGECRYIHFICTKSDVLGDLHDPSPADAQAKILNRNLRAKEAVGKEFNKLNKIKKYFSNECFKVFTVSSAEFLKPKNLKPEDTEIPELQDFLQNLNDSHSVTLNYVSGAQGILSLIQGASLKKVANCYKVVCDDLETNLNCQLDGIRDEMREIYSTFVKCLDEGVETSKSSCKNTLKFFLYPTRKSGSAQYYILKSVVKNGGIHKPKKGKEINFNMKLTSFLNKSIDEEFRKTFPNEGNCGPFNGVINKFSLDTEKLKPKYTDAGLQLTFLKTEEEKIKTKLNKIIRDNKKVIYMSLTKTVEEIMKECYEKAAEFRGKNTLQNIRETIHVYVHNFQNSMFEKAKNVMLDLLLKLMADILGLLEKDMMESIELSLKTEDCTIPDVSTELGMVQKLWEELNSGMDT